MTALTNRYDLILLFDCSDGNPNGDPEAGNMPRVDPETLQGLVSDVCQKRKLRDWVYLTQMEDGRPKWGYDIFFGHSGLPERQVLNAQIEEAHLASLSQEEREQYERASDKTKALKEQSKKHARDAAGYLCRTRFDIRTFGAVLSTGLNAGQVRGPVQCTFARSTHPVLILEAAITRKAVAKQEDADKQMAEDGIITGTMGRKNLIPYGLYLSRWFVNPKLAHQTGFSQEDFHVLCDGLINMFETDRSASRGMMATRALYAFRHQNELGNARSHQLFDRLSLTRKNPDLPPRAFSDYRITLDRSDLPPGISVYNLCEPASYRELLGDQ